MNKKGFGFLGLIIIIIIVALSVSFFDLDKEPPILESNFDLNNLEFNINDVKVIENGLEIRVENVGSIRIDGFKIEIIGRQGSLIVREETVVEVYALKTITVISNSISEIKNVKMSPAVILGEDVAFIDKKIKEYSLEEEEPIRVGYGCVFDDECYDGNPLTIDTCKNFECRNKLTECSDGRDNDNDQFIDMDDSSCKAPRDNSEN